MPSTDNRFLALLRETLSISLPAKTLLTIRLSNERFDLVPGPLPALRGVGFLAIEVCVQLEGSGEERDELVRTAHVVHSGLIERLWERIPLTVGWRLLFQACRLAGQEYVELGYLDEGRLDMLLLE